MGDTLDHASVNPYQLHYYGTRVQDKPMSEIPLFIITEDGGFIVEISMEVTVVFLTHTHLMKSSYVNVFVSILAHHILGF